MTLKQKRFADEYIISGNATEAALKAGYSKNTAGVIGHENLKKPNISDYISNRLEKIKSQKTMQLEEAVEKLSSIARREEQQYLHRKKVTTEDGSEEIKTEGCITPTTEEQTKALELIVKLYGGFTDKQEIKLDVPVLFEGEDEISD